MIPGSNVLNMAFSIIAKQSVIYYRFIGRTLNDVGQDVATYEPGSLLKGSFQPVQRNLYEALGLDLQKEYYWFYVSKALMDVSRNVSGDQLAFQGNRFQCESSTDWFAMDGWLAILCVRIGLDGGNLNLFGFNTIPRSNTYQNFGYGNFIADET